eukprot:3608782-Lingulodinium_polyedra.AAC.1
MAVPDIGFIELVRTSTALVLKHKLTGEEAELLEGSGEAKLFFNAEGKGYVHWPSSNQTSWATDIFKFKVIIENK